MKSNIFYTNKSNENRIITKKQYQEDPYTKGIEEKLQRIKKIVARTGIQLQLSPQEQENNRLIFKKLQDSVDDLNYMSLSNIMDLGEEQGSVARGMWP